MKLYTYAYLLFVLLYFPCIATTSTAYKESSFGWSVFMLVWTTGIAYFTATLFYQLATFSQHPGVTISWVMAAIVILLSVVFGFRSWGIRDQAYTKEELKTSIINTSIRNN